METVNASYFKTHFGSILDSAAKKSVRIKRRGRQSAILLSEAEFEKIQRQARSASQERKGALERLRHLASGSLLLITIFDRTRGPERFSISTLSMIAGCDSSL